MSSSNMGVLARLLAALRGQSPTDALGSAAAAAGIVLVALGIVLREAGVDFGAAVRTLGGLLLLGGLAAVLLWEPRRRAAVIGAARRIAEWYMASTAAWRWPDRVGLAAMAIGLALLPPALVVQIIFGTVFGVMVIAPGIVLFWAGAALLVYGRLHRAKAGRSSYASPSRREGRGRDQP